jgi:phosphoadenosine phosphosulfate reductase
MSEVLMIPEARELADLSARFETAPASAVVRWARETFGPGVVLASSFQDCVLVDIAVSVAPELEVVFLDTGFHFEETLEYVEQVRRRYDLNLRVVRPEIGADRPVCGSEGCCQVRKVEPLNRVLEGRQAWMTGLRRADAASRSDTPILSIDPARAIVKINPLAPWTDDDVAGYVADHGLPVHPLTRHGYLSIGCAPTTQPALDPSDPRSGRWAGSDRTECGLHL